MKVLTPGFELGRFWENLRSAEQRLLMLDYDGTLAPFRARWRTVSPYPGVREALAALARDPRLRLAVVSGRSATDLVRLLAPLRPEIWGSHGLERLEPDGRYEAPAMTPDAFEAVAAEREHFASQGWSQLLEPKPFGIALHRRGSPPAVFARAEREARRRWGLLAARGLRPVEFDGGLELRPIAGDKSLAVRRMLATASARAAAAYLGDDLTDEDAFRVVRGRGIAVLVRKTLRETAADLWIRPPAELLRFLESWREACS